MWAHIADHWSDGVNAIGAWLAAMAHVYAATNVSGHLRRLFITIASLALLYSIAYWVLFFELVGVQEWSNFLRPWGIITWGVAWAVEPVVFIHYLKRLGGNMEARAAGLAQRVADRIDE